jgi:hypothetical protein
MMLLIHIVIALASIVYTALVFIRPSASKLTTTYVLFSLTLATGTYLVWSKPTHLAQSCLEGLAYFTLISFGIVSATRKLVKENATR